MKVTISCDRETVFLVQRTLENGDRYASLMDAADLCTYLNFQDCCSEDYEIWDITTPGMVYKCHYAGWQKNCLVEVIRDFDDKIVCSMYGEDH